MQVIYKNKNGVLINGDNIEVLKRQKDNFVDSCISDFPYWLEFMGKKWDKGMPYDFSYPRAVELFRLLKPGGYVLIFGHPKTNHRMKCAFEDAGFEIVEEIDWVYGTGFPKNQDIGKLFDKKAGKQRPLSEIQRPIGGKQGVYEGQGGNWGETQNIPQTEEAKQWNGWKTTGLKPAHEPITVFQKPIEKNYCNNIEKYSCGAMNIDACRIPTSQEDKDIINAKASKNPTTNYSDSEERIYGAYAEDKSMPANEIGRFPANIIFDSSMGEILDSQSGISKGNSNPRIEKSGDSVISKIGGLGLEGGRPIGFATNQYGDEGGASRYFLKIDADDFVPFYYCAKPTKKEKGEGNSHVTVKPKELIKWLIKLVTHKDGVTIDITAGSGTHAVAVEELNKDEGYNLKWLDIELMNTEEEPFCDIAKSRIEKVNQI
jgi:site-specific DNA-methyltransferase (adenine-specific)